MSNYKSNVLNDEPVTFWTFDFDQQVLVGNEIIDEIGNTNPLFVAGTNYAMRKRALNDLEITDQYAISISPIEKANGTWASSCTLESPHSSDFQVDEFTLELFVHKNKAGLIRERDEIGYLQTVESPIIRKGGLMSMVYVDHWGGSDYISVTILDHTLTHQDSTLRPVFDIDTHIALKYEVEQVDVNEYKTIASFFMNGMLVDQSTINYFDSYPVAEGTTSWLLASNGGSEPLTDYQTEELILDQIAFYNKPLPDETISTHYRKTQRYEELIKLDIPTQYWRFNDLPSIDSIAENLITEWDGQYYGNYFKYEAGSDKIIDTHSARMNNGGVCVMGNVDHSQHITPDFVDTRSDYTVEFWFKTSDSSRGLLFSTMSRKPNWNGLNIFINSNNDFETIGSIQVSESADIKFNSDDTNFNDDKWHHLVVLREGNYIRLYVDNDLQGELNSTPFTHLDNAVITIMGSAPNSLGIDGSIGELSIYNYALQHIMINNRFHFATRHYIFGHTLLEGAPVSAKVRLYNSFTGEKVGEVQSEQGTGEYTYYPYSNRPLDLVALIPDNNTTRYRIHAPITPTEFDDSHLQT